MKANPNPIWALCVLPLLIMGCKANHEPLDEYVQQVERQVRKQAIQLEPAAQLFVQPYTQRMGREPFVLPKEAVVHTQPKVKTDCWQPRSRSKSGRLERYPIGKLRLKGVMGSGGAISGLVQTPLGSVEKVKNGQYMGLNNGQVIQVNAKYLLINETLPDGLGCWYKRHVKLALK
ncbi:pilus assembly protein PilP [Vibrio genomosp. F6]